jgi:DNA repair protein SbcC/Rad50
VAGVIPQDDTLPEIVTDPSLESGDPLRNKELEDAISELERVSAENRQLRESLQSYMVEKPVLRVEQMEEAQALTLAAETARQIAEDKVLELSRLLHDSVQQVQSMQGEIESLSHSQRLAEEQLAQLNTEKLSLQSEIDSLSGRLLELEQSSENGKASPSADELEAALKKLQQENYNLRSEIEDYQLALETSEDQIQFFEDEIEDRELIVDSLQKQVGAYLDKLRLAQTKLYAVGEAVDKRNSWLKQLQEQNVNLLARSRHWEQLYREATSLDLAEELSKKEGELEDLRWELQETQVSLEDTLGMVTSFQDQLQRQFPEAHRKLVEMQSQYQAAISQLDEANSKLEQLQQVETLLETDVVEVLKQEPADLVEVEQT